MISVAFRVPRTLFLSLVVLLIQACVPLQPPPAPTPRVTLSPNFIPEAYDRFAVIAFDQTKRLRRGGGLRQVEEEFMRAVIEKGYTVVARSDVDRIIEELNFQTSSLTEQQIARIGHLLNVSAVLLVSVNHLSTERYRPVVYVQGKRYFATTVSIGARLIAAERGEVLWISSYTGKYTFSGQRSNEGEMQGLAPVAQIVASGLPARNSFQQ